MTDEDERRRWFQVSVDEDLNVARALASLENFFKNFEMLSHDATFLQTFPFIRELERNGDEGGSDVDRVQNKIPVSSNMSTETSLRHVVCCFSDLRVVVQSLNLNFHGLSFFIFGRFRHFKAWVVTSN